MTLPSTPNNASLNFVIAVDKFNVIGGQERYIVDLISSSAFSSYSAHLLSFHPKAISDEFFLQSSPVILSRFWPFFYSFLWKFFFSRSRVKLVLLANSLASIPFTLLFALFFKAKLFYIAHLSSSQLKFLPYYKRLILCFFEKIFLSSYFSPITTVCVSKSVQSLLSPRTSHVILNSSIFPSVLPPRVSSEFRRHLVWIGRLDYQKNPFLLLHAYSHYLNTSTSIFFQKLFVIGKGPLLEDLRSLCVQLGLSQRVFFLGNLPKNEISAFFPCTQISTSHYEGMPLSIIEGLLSYNDLILSRIPSHLELKDLDPRFSITVYNPCDHIGLSSILCQKDDCLTSLDSSKFIDGLIASAELSKSIFSQSLFVSKWSSLLPNV